MWYTILVEYKNPYIEKELKKIQTPSIKKEKKNTKQIRNRGANPHFRWHDFI